MATPTADSYSASAGTTLVRGGRGVPIGSALPTWRSGLAPWQWVELGGTALSNVNPIPNPGGDPGMRLNAWNGVSVIGKKIIVGGVGGHADYAGNEVYSWDLNTNTPSVPTMLIAPTPTASILTDTKYYADGRPTSSHTYYALHGVSSLDRMFRFGIGAGWGSGNFQRSTVDAFNLLTNTWDVEGTWADVPGNTEIGRGQCRDAASGNIYVASSNAVYRWVVSSQTWQSIGALANGPSGATYRAMAFDHVRGRLVVFGDASLTGSANVYNGTSWSIVTLSGAFASTATSFSGFHAHYDAAIDRFIMRESAAGGALISIHPTTWATESLATSGGGGILAAVNGVFGKFQPMTELNGYIYIPRTTSNVWFIAGA